MNIVHLNTEISVSSAPYRLHNALLSKGIHSKILTIKAPELSGVEEIPISFYFKVKRKIVSKIRNYKVSKYQPMNHMPLSFIPYGIDISKHSDIEKADIIMIHWVCNDYMSPRTIEKLLNTGKPVYWTCHDNYPFTGGCHVRLGCEKYCNGCGECPQLSSNRKNDLSAHLIDAKRKLLPYDNLYFLSPSSWMDHNVSKSIFSCKEHFILPNAIDTELFRAYQKVDCRTKWEIDQDAFVILLGLKANEKIPYNGTEYVWKVLNLIHSKYPEHRFKGRSLQVVVFGVREFTNKSEFDIRNVGFVSGQADLAMLYAAADMYIVTSLEDSFNQTVAECMACDTPVVAFDNGGIADIIDHMENGYLAKYKDVEDMVKGIEQGQFPKSPRSKIIESFSYPQVAEKFEDIMNRNDKG